MNFKKGDRVLYNRQKFGTVWSNQFNPSKVDVVFDREKGKIVLVGIDMLELVADAQHEAVLAALINSPQAPGTGVAAELDQLAFELEAGADTEKNTLRLRATMKNAALRLRALAKHL